MVFYTCADRGPRGDGLLTLSTRDSVGKFLLLGKRIAVNARLDELRGPVNGGTPSRRDLYMANVTACTNTYEYQASVPQRAGLEIRLMLPLCSCNDNHDVRQTVIVIDTDLTCQILSRTREIDRKNPSPGLVLKWRRLS